MERPPLGTPKMPEVIDFLQENCGVRAALDVIRGRWKPLIMCHLHLRACRYSELQQALPNVSAQALSTQLRELERDGIVARRVTEDSPPRTVYELTDYGWTLGEVMERLEAWGNDFLKRREAASDSQNCD